jgi:flagellar basal-body rod protein FlgB
MDWLSSIPITLLNKDLDGLWTRQQAISDNIANMETPGYQDKTVSFEDQLRQQLEVSGSEQDVVDGIQNVVPEVQQSDTTLRADGNGVDLEQQNTEMARTELNYNTSLQEISDSFSRLKTAIGSQD